MNYLAWSSSDRAAHLGDGPWSEAFRLGPGLHLIESDQRRSVVYHAVKDAVPAGSALLVVALTDEPKFKGLAPGAAARLRVGASPVVDPDPGRT